MLRKRAVPLAAAVVAAALVSVPVAAIGGNTTALWSDSVTLATNITITPGEAPKEEAGITLISSSNVCLVKSGGTRSFEEPITLSVVKGEYRFLAISLSSDGWKDHVNDFTVGTNPKVQVAKGSTAQISLEGQDLTKLVIDVTTHHNMTANRASFQIGLASEDEGEPIWFLTVGPFSSLGDKLCAEITPDSSSISRVGTVAGGVTPSFGDWSAEANAFVRAEGDAPPEAAPAAPVADDAAELTDPDAKELDGPGGVAPGVVRPEVDPETGALVPAHPAPAEPGEELEADSPAEGLDPVPTPDEPEADDSAPDGSEVEGPLAIVPLPQLIEPAPAPEPEAVEPDVTTPDAEHEDCEHLNAEHSADECPGLLPEDEAVKPEPEEGVEPEPAPEPEPEDGVEPEPEPSPDEVL